MVVTRIASLYTHSIINYLTPLQTRLAESVETGQNFRRHKSSIADRTLGVGAGEASTTQRGGGETWKEQNVKWRTIIDLKH